MHRGVLRAAFVGESGRTAKPIEPPLRDYRPLHVNLCGNRHLWIYDIHLPSPARPVPAAVTTIKKFVGTEACAVDDTIFLADFTTCDFQFVEVCAGVRGGAENALVRCVRTMFRQAMQAPFPPTCPWFRMWWTMPRPSPPLPATAPALSSLAW